MGYPVAVSTRQIVVGPFLDGAGNPITNGQATIVASRAVLWHAGQPDQAWMLAVPETRKLDANGQAVFTRPVTDQVGWTDGVGGQVLGWTYSVRVNLGRGEQAPPAAVFPLPAGGALQVVFDGSGLVAGGVVSRLDTSAPVLDAAMAARIAETASATRAALASIWRGVYYADSFATLYSLAPQLPVGSIVEVGACTVPGAGAHYRSFWRIDAAGIAVSTVEPILVDTLATLQQLRAHIIAGGLYSSRLVLDNGVSCARIGDPNRTEYRWSRETPGQWRPVPSGIMQVLTEKSAAQAIPATQWTIVDLGADLYDPYDMHVTGSPAVLNAPWDGLYEYGIRWAFQNDIGTTGASGAALVNQATSFRYSEQMTQMHLANHGQLMSDRASFAAGTPLRFEVYSSIANGIAYGSPFAWTRAWLRYIGPLPTGV